MYRHMDANSAAGIHEHERARQRCRSAGTRVLRRGISGRSSSRLLLHRARSSCSTVFGRHLIYFKVFFAT